MFASSGISFDFYCFGLEFLLANQIGGRMNITVGIAKSTREIVVATDKTVDQLQEIVEKAYENGLLVLDDTNNNGRFVIPTKRIDFIHFGEKKTGTVGFGL